MKSKFSILTTAVAAVLLSLPLGTIAKEPEHADAPKVSPADALVRREGCSPQWKLLVGRTLEATVKANIDNVGGGVALL